MANKIRKHISSKNKPLSEEGYIYILQMAEGRYSMSQRLAQSIGQKTWFKYVNAVYTHTMIEIMLDLTEMMLCYHVWW